MIVIYAELWPDGDQNKARPLGSIGIANTTRPGDLLDNYQFEIDEAPNPALRVERLERKGVVLAHNRNQSVWKLVRRVLDQVFPQLVLDTQPPKG